MGEALVVRYETRPETAEENQRLIEGVFTQLAMEEPEGLRYAVFRLVDGVTFVHVAIDDAEVLPSLSAFQTFPAGIADRIATAVTPSAATPVGSYRCGGGR
ncbi:hypothetical protein ACFWYW_58220 [Nonomuraea sp. NPDC059023]|uniref:hypothetical protein n=1 Tax=unclassified Nonomuraea TaxID=2593643 RepID=UPI003688EF4C